MPECEADFADIAFNEHGDLLYAWAVGQQGSCFCFGITGAHAGNSSCTGRYDWVFDMILMDIENLLMNECQDWSQKMEQARLHPFARRRGCLVVPDAGYVFSARFNHITSSTSLVNMPNTPAQHPTLASAKLRASEVKAASMFNDHVFVTIKGGLFAKAHVNEFRISQQERQTVGSLTKLCEVQTSIKKGLQMKASRYENYRLILIVICDLEGKMEIIKFGIEADATGSRRSPGR